MNRRDLFRAALGVVGAVMGMQALVALPKARPTPITLPPGTFRDTVYRVPVSRPWVGGHGDYAGNHMVTYRVDTL